MPFKFTSGVKWGLSFHTFSCELRVHHSFKQGPDFSVCFYRNHMETVKTLVKNELWCTWKALWIISARSCTFNNQSWNLAGCSGWLLTAPRAQDPIQASLNPLGALPCIPPGFGSMFEGQLAWDLFSKHDTGEVTKVRRQFTRNAARGGHHYRK